MKQESIAIDLDNVLAAHVEAFIQFSNAQFGTNLTIDDYDDHFANIWKVEQKEIERRSKLFHVPNNYAKFEVKEESKEALRRLNSEFNLFIVTARGSGLVEISFDWVNRYYPGIFKGIHFVPSWGYEKTKTKADICKNIDANYLIDDLARHCNEAAESGINAILFGDYGWNRNENTIKNVTRCKNWPEVLKYFESRTSPTSQ